MQNGPLAYFLAYPSNRSGLFLSVAVEELDGILEEPDDMLEDLNGMVESVPIAVPEDLLGIAEEDSDEVAFLALEGLFEQAPSIITEAMTKRIANDLSFILDCSFYINSLCGSLFGSDLIHQPQ